MTTSRGKCEGHFFTGLCLRFIGSTACTGKVEGSGSRTVLSGSLDCRCNVLQVLHEHRIYSDDRAGLQICQICDFQRINAFFIGSKCFLSGLTVFLCIGNIGSGCHSFCRFLACIADCRGQLECENFAAALSADPVYSTIGGAVNDQCVSNKILPFHRFAGISTFELDVHLAACLDGQL